MSDDHTNIIPAEQVAVEPRREPDIDELDISPVVRRILDGGLGAEALAQLQWVDSLQKAHDADRRLVAFTRSMVAMKADPDFASVIAHDIKVAFGQTRYSYTSLPAIVAELTPFLTRYGFTVSWIPQYDGGKKVGVTCRLFHIGGHIEEAYLPANLTEKKGMSNAQEMTGTQTTLKRNTVLSLLGLASGEMEPPVQQPDADAPADPLRVAEALQRLSRMGITKDEAEYAMEAPADKWTVGIMRDLTVWVRDRRKAEGE